MTWRPDGASGVLSHCAYSFEPGSLPEPGTRQAAQSSCLCLHFRAEVMGVHGVPGLQVDTGMQVCMGHQAYKWALECRCARGTRLLSGHWNANPSHHDVAAGASGS